MDLTSRDSARGGAAARQHRGRNGAPKLAAATDLHQAAGSHAIIPSMAIPQRELSMLVFNTSLSHHSSVMDLLETSIVWEVEYHGQTDWLT